MAKNPSSQKPAATPEDFPQVEPTELFPTNNIRFVIVETSKLIERVDTLSKAITKSDDRIEKALERQAADVKERLSDFKSDAKDTRDKLDGLKSSVDSFKGAMKVLGGIYAFVLVLAGALITFYLRSLSLQGDEASTTTEESGQTISSENERSKSAERAKPD